MVMSSNVSFRFCFIQCNLAASQAGESSGPQGISGTFPGDMNFLRSKGSNSRSPESTTPVEDGEQGSHPRKQFRDPNVHDYGPHACCACAEAENGCPYHLLMSRAGFRRAVDDAFFA